MEPRTNNPLCRVGTVESVNMDTGERVPIEGGGLFMLPPKPGLCAWCATAHAAEMPHNNQSLYYQMKFHAIYGRWPTWTDAMAHCSPAMQATWRKGLVEQMAKHGLEIPEDLR